MDKVKTLQQKLDDWIASCGPLKPSKEQIESNPIYIQQTILLKQLCAPPAPTGCQWFVRRRGRYCTKQQTLGSQFCGLHRQPVAAIPQQSATSKITHGCRKTNPRKRMKRMLNPFKIAKTDPESLPLWSSLLSTPSLPLWLDIGCAKGRYIHTLASSYADSSCTSWIDSSGTRRLWNFVGIEIYPPLVENANAIYARENIAYINANVVTDLECLKLPGSLERVSIMFPDPWGCMRDNVQTGKSSISASSSISNRAMRKNAKKRVVTAEFAARLAAAVVPGGHVYFASDWVDLAMDIRTCLLNTGQFIIPSAAAALEQQLVVGDSISLTDKSHVARFPFVPTIGTRKLGSEQARRQREVSERIGVDLIDVQTDYQKPMIFEGDGKEDNDEEVLWLEGIPYDGVQTERDLVCESEWRAVYRLVLFRK